MECVECAQSLHQTVEIPSIRLSDSTSICLPCLQHRIQPPPLSHRSGLGEQPTDNSGQSMKLSPVSRPSFLPLDSHRSRNMPSSRGSISSISPAGVIASIPQQQQHVLHSDSSPALLHLPHQEEGTLLRKFNNFIVSPTNSTLSNLVHSEREIEMALSPNCQSASFHHQKLTQASQATTERKGSRGFTAIKGQFQGTGSATTNTAASSIHRKHSSPSAANAIQQSQMKLYTLTESTVKSSIIKKQNSELMRASQITEEPSQSKQMNDVMFFGVDMQKPKESHYRDSKIHQEAQKNIENMKRQKKERQVAEEKKNLKQQGKESLSRQKINSTANEVSAAEWASQETTVRGGGGVLLDSTGPASPLSYQQQRQSLGVRMPSEMKLASQIASAYATSTMRKNMSHRKSVQEEGITRKKEVQQQVSQYEMFTQKENSGITNSIDQIVGDDNRHSSKQQYGLQLIQEKDSQPSTSRQLSVKTDHFIQGLQWDNFDMLDSLVGEFQLNPKRLVCPQHKDVVSLYCEKDQMLLCVSCLFDSQEHAKHTVVPLQAAKSSIIANTNLFRLQVKELTTNIEGEMRKSEGNRILLERSYEKCLDQIAKEFQGLKNRLISRQRDLEEQVTRQFENAIQKYDALMKDFKEITTTSAYQQKANQIMGGMIGRQQTQINNAEIDFIVKDHFVFDRLLQTLKSVKISVQDITKSDLDIFAFKQGQLEDFKYVVQEIGNIKCLTERQIAIRNTDSISNRMVSTLNSPRGKIPGNTSSSRSRDVTSSNSPSRFNYVQKTLQAHLSQTKQKSPKQPPPSVAPNPSVAMKKSNQTKTSMKTILNHQKPPPDSSSLHSPHKRTQDLTQSVQQRSIDGHDKSQDSKPKYYAHSNTSQTSNKAINKISSSNHGTSKHSNFSTSNASVPLISNGNQQDPHHHSTTTAISRVVPLEQSLKNNRSGVGYVPSNAISVYLQNKRFREQSGQSLSMN